MLGLPAMVNMMAFEEGSVWHEGSLISAVEGCKILEATGADVVGLNCHRGPATMVTVIEKVKQEIKVIDKSFCGQRNGLAKRVNIHSKELLRIY